MDLRQRVENGAGRLVEQQAAPDVERPLQHRFGARERAKVDADLSERRERHGQAVTGRELLVQRDAAFGQRQRLLVAMANHRHVRLVAAHDGQHVVGADRRGEPLGLAQRRQRLVVAARSGPARCRTASARARDCAGRRPRAAPTRPRRSARAWSPVADVLVAAGELEMREADGAQVVRLFAAERRPADAARWRATDRRAPRRRVRAAARDARGVTVEPLSRMVSGGRPSAALGLGHIVLQQPGFGEDDADARSSSRVRDVERSACCESCVASAPWPRSSAACARAMIGCSATLTTGGVYRLDARLGS